MIGIYKITSPTGKIYIGQSWNIEDRFRKYKRLNCKMQIKLYNSFSKYGPDEHIFDIIHILPIDCNQNIMNNYETFYYECYKILGVNMLNVREPGSNGKLSQETKDKIREATRAHKIGRKQSQETIDKRVSKTKGMKRTSVQRNNMSQGRKGMKFSEEHRKNLSISHKGNKNAKKND